MRKLILLIIIQTIYFCATAQNHFVYVRYSPGDGNASSIVRYVENLMELDNTVIVFLSKSDESVISKNRQQWDALKDEMLSMQSTPDLYSTIELEQLNRLMIESLIETVEIANEDGLSIVGKHDSKWDFRFLLSEEMFKQANDLEIVPLEFISVNELQSRFRVIFMSYNEDGDIEQCATPYNEMFNFKK